MRAEQRSICLVWRVLYHCAQRELCNVLCYTITQSAELVGVAFARWWIKLWWKPWGRTNITRAEICCEIDYVWISQPNRAQSWFRIDWWLFGQSLHWCSWLPLRYPSFHSSCVKLQIPLKLSHARWIAQFRMKQNSFHISSSVEQKDLIHAYIALRSKSGQLAYCHSRPER